MSSRRKKKGIRLQIDAPSYCPRPDEDEYADPPSEADGYSAFGFQHERHVNNTLLRRSDSKGTRVGYDAQPKRPARKRSTSHTTGQSAQQRRQGLKDGAGKQPGQGGEKEGGARADKMLWRVQKLCRSPVGA